MKKRLVVAVVLSAALCLGACGGAKSGSAANENYAAESADYEYDATESAAEESYARKEAAASDTGDASGGDNDSALRAQDGQKIVYTGNLNLQTLEYDKSASSIRKKIKDAGGFTESESETDNNYYWYDYTGSNNNTRTLNLTARIPSDKFEEFLNSLSGDGKIMSRSMNAENISQVYANKETYKKALEKEQERLLAMMDKAETIEEMITVESRLSEVERQLNVYKTDLAEMDKDVEYSTVYIELKEVKRYTEKVDTTTFGQRVKYAFDDAISSFKEFCEGVVLFVVRYFPYLILFAIIIALLIRKAKKSRARRIAMMSDPEYAKLMNAKERAKAEAAARKRAEKEAKRNARGGLFGRKKAEPPAVNTEKQETVPEEDNKE